MALAAGSALAQTVEEMRLTVGKSIVLDYPADIRQISTADPGVVDAVAVSTREVLLNAKGAGAYHCSYLVTRRPTNHLQHHCRTESRTAPPTTEGDLPERNDSDSVHQGFIALTGQVSTKDVADRAMALVTPFGKSIVNNLKVAPLPVDKQIS